MTLKFIRMKIKLKKNKDHNLLTTPEPHEKRLVAKTKRIKYKQQNKKSAMSQVDNFVSIFNSFVGNEIINIKEKRRKSGALINSDKNLDIPKSSNSVQRKLSAKNPRSMNILSHKKDWIFKSRSKSL